MLTSTYNLLRRTFVICSAVAAAAFSTGALAQYTCSFPATAPNGSFTISCTTSSTSTGGTGGTGGTTTSGGNFALTGSTSITAGSSGNVTVTRSGGTTGAYNVSVSSSPSNVCSGAGTLAFADGASAATSGNVVSITGISAGTCTVTVSLSAPNGNIPTTPATTSGSPLSITIAGASTAPPPPPPPSSGCPALPSNYTDVSGPTAYGVNSTIRLASGTIGGFALPLTTANHNSATMQVGENVVSPNGGIVIELSINKCKGVIDPNSGSCYLRSSIATALSIQWAGKNSANYPAATLDAIGFCPAFESQGQWFMNVRYTYSACNYGTCGEVFAWYDSYY